MTPSDLFDSPASVNLADARRIALDHAWDWFSLHSAQRMQLVNFWIVALVFLTNALVMAATRRTWPAVVVVGLLGALATLGFRRMDQRTRRLVKFSEAALRCFQQELADQTHVPELEIILASDSHGRLESCTQIIGFMHWLVIVTFGAVGLLVGCRWVASLVGGWQVW